MHQYFDGIETEGNTPLVKLEPVSVGPLDPTIRRYPVKIAVVCKSRVIFDGLIPFMQHGAIVDDVELTIVVTVQVERHTEFCDRATSAVERLRQLGAGMKKTLTGPKLRLRSEDLIPKVV